MQQYYVDLRSCNESEHDRIMKLVNAFAWDVYLVADVPKVYAFMWSRKESVHKIPGIPDELISSHPPHNT